MSLPVMTNVEAERLVRISNKLRKVLRAWKATKGVTRADGLCACIVLAGSEGGLEGALSREEFLAVVVELATWAYDLGVQTRKDIEEDKGGAAS